MITSRYGLYDVIIGVVFCDVTLGYHDAQFPIRIFGFHFGSLIFTTSVTNPNKWT